MPIPQGIWDLLLANTAASGQSQNPYALGQTAQKTTGGSLDEMIAEAKQRLAGTYRPPVAAGPSPMIPPVPSPFDPSIGGGSDLGGPTGDPSSAASITGGRAPTGGFAGGLAGTALGLGGAMLGGVPQLALPFTVARLGNAIANAANMTGVSLDANNMPSSIQDIPDPMFSNINDIATTSSPAQREAAAIAEFGGRTGAPTGVTGQSSTGVPFGGPGRSPDLDSPREAVEDQTAGGGAGPGGASPSGPGPGEAGPAASEGAGGQSPYRGGYLPGPRTKKKKVPEAHGGEFVFNNAATMAYGPLLEAMNASVQPNEDLDKIMDKARKFFDV